MCHCNRFIAGTPGWLHLANDRHPNGSPARSRIPVAQVSVLTLSSRNNAKVSIKFFHVATCGAKMWFLLGSLPR